jgi:hypothetical protein
MNSTFAKWSLLSWLLLAFVPGIAPAQGVHILELYSNAGGDVQFIVLTVDPLVANATLVSTQGSQAHTYTQALPPADAPAVIAHRFLLATRSFVAQHGIAADFILPDNFLFTHDAQLSSGYTTVSFDLPGDGIHSLYTLIDYDIAAYELVEGVAVATNHAGTVVALGPLDVAGQVEYYNAVLDQYFLTSFPAEIDALDSGAIAGWQRTGQTIPTWTGPELAVLPNVGPACRVLVGDSHFFALSLPQPAALPDECHRAFTIPGARVEAWDAFYAAPPDPATGSCTPGDAPLYRLWNARGTGHRYTTQRTIRDAMVQEGYVAEGFGPDSVSLCVAGGAALQ